MMPHPEHFGFMPHAHACTTCSETQKTLTRQETFHARTLYLNPLIIFKT